MSKPKDPEQFFHDLVVFHRHWTLEQIATAAAQNPAWLRYRLHVARATMGPEIREAFRGAVFDHGQRSLIGTGYTLVWTLRDRPSEPPGPQNQQCSVGVVTLITSGVK